MDFQRFKKWAKRNNLKITIKASVIHPSKEFVAWIDTDFEIGLVFSNEGDFARLSDNDFTTNTITKAIRWLNASIPKAQGERG